MSDLGDRLALARDTLLGIRRIAPFVLSLRKSWIVPEFEAKLDAVAKDIASLNAIIRRERQKMRVAQPVAPAPAVTS